MAGKDNRSAQVHLRLTADCIQSSPNRQNDLSKIDTPLTRIG